MKIEITFKVSESEMDKFKHEVEEKTRGYLTPGEAIEVTLQREIGSLMQAKLENVKVKF